MSEAVILALSSAFSVMALSIFMAAASSPRFASLLSSMETARKLLAVSSAAIVLFVAASGWFYAEHYLRRRKRELASWLLLGMGEGRAILAVSAEFAAAALVSLATGLCLGALFSRFFAIVLAALMRDRAPVEMPFGWASVAAASIACAAQWIVASSRAAYDIRRSSLIDLLKADRAVEAPSVVSRRRRPVLAVAGALLALAGYACATLASGAAAESLMLPVLASVVAGTFLSFSALVPFLLGAFRARLARGDAATLVAMAQLAFRSRRNAGLLAISSILVAIAASAIGSVLALDIRDRDMVRRICPHDLELSSSSPEALARIEGILSSAGMPDAALKRREIAWLNGRSVSKGLPVEVQYFSRTAWDSAVEALGEKAGNGSGKLRAYLSSHDKERVDRSPAFPPLSVITALDAFEVDDGEYAMLRSTFGPEQVSAIWDGLPADSLRRAGPRLEAFFPEGLVSRPIVLDGQGRLYGVMLFIGAFLSATFVLAASALLAFRSIEDLRDDGDRYLAMLRIGAPRKTLRRALLLQNGCIFGLPLAVGLCHTAFALAMMRNIAGYASLAPTLVVSALLAAAMGAVALYATNSQEAQVEALIDRS
jgi:putative ABC transport system permease protein